MGGRKTKINVDELSDQQLRELVPQLAATIQSLQTQLAEMARALYGRSSEKGRYLDQSGLLPFAELDAMRDQAAAAQAAAGTIKIGEHEREATKRRKEFPDHLPRQRTEFSVAGAELDCPECGEPRREFGEDVTQDLERLEISFVHEIVRKKYSCSCCQGHVIVADGPDRVLDKCLLGPGFLSQVIFDRFCNHMPYARLEKKYRAEGLDLSRSVLCNLSGKCAGLLEPIFEAHVDHVLESLQTSVLQGDDTYGLERNGPAKGAKKIHVWAWRDQHGGVFYTSSTERNRGSPGQVLGDRKGRLQCDGHDSFEGLDSDSIIRIGCWAHLRRYFEKAAKNGDQPANVPLELIGKLFAIEREAKRGRDGRLLTDDELVEHRQEKSRPIADAVHAWLEQAKLEPPSLHGGPLMKGVTYGLRQWPALTRFLEDGRIREISNNGCERALRAVVIGKNNWQFFGSENGTKNSLILLSLVQSCRELGISPLLYLRDVLRAVSTTPASEVSTLTPRAWKERKASEAAPELSVDRAIQDVVEELIGRA